MNKFILLLLTIILSGCATYNPEILSPVTNLNDFYKQCKNSSTLSMSSTGTLSLSDRFYCLGYVQAAAEAAIFWRKRQKDINPECRLMVSDFYYEFLYSIERGKFNDRVSIPDAFRVLSYKFCPKIQYIDSRELW